MHNNSRQYPESFTGTYFDGQTSKPMAATVCFEDKSLCINLKQHDGSDRVLKHLFSKVQSIEVIEDDRVLVHFVDPAGSVIDIQDDYFLGALKRFQLRFSLKQIDNARFFGVNLKLAAAGALLTCALFGIIFMVIIPALSVYIASAFPELEKRIGDQEISKFKKGKVIDTPRTIALRQFAARLKFGNNGDFPIDPYLVTSPDEVNAFALPGGHIVVFDSILGIMSGPEELAALLAHEYTHVSHHHAMQGIISSQFIQFLFQLIFGGLFQNSDFLDLGSFMSDIMKHNYNRSMEVDADTTAIALLKKSNIDPKGVVQLLRHLEACDSSPWWGTFIEDHPSISERIRVAEDKTGAGEVYCRDGVLDSLWKKIKPSVPKEDALSKMLTNEYQDDDLLLDDDDETSPDKQAESGFSNTDTGAASTDGYPTSDFTLPDTGGTLNQGWPEDSVPMDYSE